MAVQSSASPEKISLRRPMRSRADLESERVTQIQRGRILGAMVQQCAERPASEVTVAHVVQRAGVSRRTFYEIFENREECFLAAFDDVIERASVCVLGVYDPTASWVERVRTSLVALLSFLDAERGAGVLLIVGSAGAGTQALERRRRVLARLIDVVDEGRLQASATSGLSPLTAEGVVGGVLSVLHTRLLDSEGDSLMELTGPLMCMIVLPYLGSSAGRRELDRGTPSVPCTIPPPAPDPLRELGVRLTYRTVRVLMGVGARPGSSNRQIAEAAGIVDQGQISKLLARLHGLGLVENAGVGSIRGGANAWTLTAEGVRVERVLSGDGRVDRPRQDSDERAGIAEHAGRR